MTELVEIQIESIYKVSGKFVYLPHRMAKCTPDFKESLLNIRDDLKALGAELRLSDMFRTYDMQYKAYMDYKTGKKKAYSPPPGSSFHEAGRAIDLSLESLKPLGVNYLEIFWKIAEKYKVVPIISEPNPHKSESWHFECRGEFQKVKQLQGYKQAVKAAILDVGIDVTDIKDDEAAWLQGQILAYGIDIGPIDGIIGPKTKAAIRQIKMDNNYPHSDNVNDWELFDGWIKSFLENS